MRINLMNIHPSLSDANSRSDSKLASDRSKPLYQAQALEFAYDRKTTLEKMSFNIYRGEFLCIIGPNGSGKSTLLKLLARLNRHERGDLFFQETPITQWTQKALAKQVSYVPQGVTSDLTFSALEFVSMARYPHHSAFSSRNIEDDRAIHHALNITDCLEFKHEPMNQLSGGQRQLVLVAAALAQEAHILLLDEPTSALDPKHADDLCRLLGRLNKNHQITIVMVTHDINQASLLSHRIFALKQGKLLYQGNTANGMNREMMHQIFDKHFLFIPHPDSGHAITIPNFHTDQATYVNEPSE